MRLLRHGAALATTELATLSFANTALPYPFLDCRGVAPANSILVSWLHSSSNHGSTCSQHLSKACPALAERHRRRERSAIAATRIEAPYGCTGRAGAPGTACVQPGS